MMKADLIDTQSDSGALAQLPWNKFSIAALAAPPGPQPPNERRQKNTVADAVLQLIEQKGKLQQQSKPMSV